MHVSPTTKVYVGDAHSPQDGLGRVWGLLPAPAACLSTHTAGLVWSGHWGQQELDKEGLLQGSKPVSEESGDGDGRHEVSAVPPDVPTKQQR